MWIKICGNTRLEDCQRAAELGADAVGFVFAAGKRTVTAQQVAAIIPHLPVAIEKIGVFTSRDADEIIAAAREAGLTGVQLHGAYDPALAQAVRDQLDSAPMFRLIQVLHWDTDRTAAEQVESFTTACRAVEQDGFANTLLIDSRTQQGSGGTGVPFDWEAAKPALAGLRIPVIVAGGLRPENVAEAIRTLQPFGVDVSSGVELAPGNKDASKVAGFIQAARPVLTS
jgi:phosphoribosylanthranilate isomerase